MLETLREYGWAQLVASGELAPVRQRHHDWCLQLALRVEAAAYEREQAKWGARLEEEIDNVRAAMAWCQEQAEADLAPPAAHEGADGCPAHGSGAAALLRLFAATWWLWYLRGHVAEGLRWLEGALARGSHLPPAARALALSQAGHLYAAQGDRDRARSFMEASYCEYRSLLAITRCEGDPAAVAQVALSLSGAAFTLDDLEATERYGAEARQIFAELQDAVGLASVLHWLASAALQRRDAGSARALLAERLEICRKLDNPGLLIHALGATGHLERDEGNYARAGALYRESLLRRRELGDLFALAQALEDLAGLANRQQQPERAIRLLGAQEAFCDTLGARPPVAMLDEYERAIAEGRAALGEAAFAAVWAEGRAMSLAQAVEYALSAE
jgi:non-specific serine/threonine protein kinase